MTLVAGPVLATSAASAPRVVGEAQWRSPERNLWVGVDGSGAYLGMIERDGASYIAVDGNGREAGRFWALSDAETALAEIGEATIDPAEARRIRTAIAVAGIAGLSALGMVALGLTTIPF